MHVQYDRHMLLRTFRRILRPVERLLDVLVAQASECEQRWRGCTGRKRESGTRWRCGPAVLLHQGVRAQVAALGGTRTASLPWEPLGVPDATRHEGGGEGDAADGEQLGVDDARHALHQLGRHGRNGRIVALRNGTLNNFGGGKEGGRASHAE